MAEVNGGPLLASAFTKGPATLKTTPTSLPVAVCTLSSPLHVPRVPGSASVWERDPLCEIQVSPETLRALRLFSGDWALLHAPTSRGELRVEENVEPKTASPHRIVQLLVVDCVEHIYATCLCSSATSQGIEESNPSPATCPPDCPRDRFVVHASPTVHMWLMQSRYGGERDFSRPVAALLSPVTVALPPLRDFAITPLQLGPSGSPIVVMATSVCLSSISSNFSSGSDASFIHLRSFFSVPRILAENDIIAVKVPFLNGECIDFRYDYHQEAFDEANVQRVKDFELNIAKGHAGERKVQVGDGEADTEDVLFCKRDCKVMYYKVVSIRHVCRAPTCPLCAPKEDSKRKESDTRETIHCFAVDSRVTEIAQRGPVNHSVPHAFEDFLQTCSCPLSGDVANLMVSQTRMSISCTADSNCAPEGAMLCANRRNFVDQQENANEEKVSKLSELVAVFLHPLSQKFFSLQTSSFLLRGQRGSGKRTVVYKVAKTMGMHVIEVNCFELLSEREEKTRENLMLMGEVARRAAPCFFLLRHVHALEMPEQAMGRGSEGGEETAAGGWFRSSLSNLCVFGPSDSLGSAPVLLVATSGDDSNTKISADLRSCFQYEIPFGALERAEREAVLSTALGDLKCVDAHTTAALAAETAAFTASHISSIVSRGIMSAVRDEIAAATDSDNDAESRNEGDASSFKISEKHLREGLGEVRDFHAAESAVGGATSARIPTVKWEDVGGLHEAKKDIIDTIQLPLKYPQLFASGMKRRSGVLLYGPPGTGKTLLAKAVATECSLNFMSVKGPELVNMYVGQSEKNVREVFAKARAARPCVIFFDELDSLAPNRGKSGDSGGVMDRVVSQFLAELDGLDHANDVFVIGATNRPDLLDPALLRPGRFDRLVYLGVCETHEGQLQIISAITRKFALDPELTLERVAEALPLTLTGADLFALCSDAYRCAIRERVQELEGEAGSSSLGEMKDERKHVVLVRQRHFQQALDSITPSVSESDMRYYREVQAKYTT